MSDVRIALIPAYKPSELFVQLCEKLRGMGFEVVAVNDGSGEEFDRVFEQAARWAQIVPHPTNRGKGAALKTGLQYIKWHYEAPYTVVTVDADGQHTPEDTLAVCSAAAENRSALVLGCRSFEGKVPLKSRLGNEITKVVFRLCSGVWVNDTQTGLRAFSDRHIDRLTEIEGDRYEYEMNMLSQYARDCREIREVPITTVYIDDNSSSHFDSLKDSFRIYKELLRFSASSFASFCIDYIIYCLLSAMTGSAVLANVTARLFSSAANFEINRRYVFKSEGNAARSAVQYFLLAAFVLAINSLVLYILTAGLGVNIYLAKIIVETAMFLFNWAVQRSFIFKKKGAAEK